MGKNKLSLGAKDKKTNPRRPKPRRGIAETFNVASDSQLLIVAENLGIAKENRNDFVKEVVRTLAFKVFFPGTRPTPANVVAGLERIKLEAERLLSCGVSGSLVMYLNAIVETCVRIQQELYYRKSGGRPKKGGISLQILELRKVFAEFAPGASNEKIKNAICCCLDIADIKYPDPKEHASRFNEMIFGVIDKIIYSHSSSELSPIPQLRLEDWVEPTPLPTSLRDGLAAGGAVGRGETLTVRKNRAHSRTSVK